MPGVSSSAESRLFRSFNSTSAIRLPRTTPVGFAALLLLVPLALTSTKRMIKRLGGKRWNRLHKLVYLIAALGVLHFFWLVKADTREPLIFGGVLAILLGYRALAGRLRQLKAQKAKLRGAALALEPQSTPTEGAGAG